MRQKSMFVPDAKKGLVSALVPCEQPYVENYTNQQLQQLKELYQKYGAGFWRVGEASTLVH